MKGEILGGVVPIGSVLEVGGSLIVGRFRLVWSGRMHTIEENIADDDTCAPCLC